MVMFLASHSQFSTTYTDLGSQEMRSFHGHENVMCWCGSVAGWRQGSLTSQTRELACEALNDEPKPVYSKLYKGERKGYS
jgi:hypothetical protein